MNINEALQETYFAKPTEKPSKPGCWNVLTVEIWKRDPSLFDDPGVKIGEYERNYPSLFNTFHPFVQDGQVYALYSKDYTATRVMSLPDCKDICGEERDSFGFCPTGYAVPYSTDECGCEKFPCEYCGRKAQGEDLFNGQFGFVCGCIWGDDSSWKIQYLDLSDLKNGKIKRESWMGYVEMGEGSENLRDYIVTKSYERDDHLIGVKGVQWFRNKKACDPDRAQIQDLTKAWQDVRGKLDKFEGSRLHCLRQAFRLPKILTRA